MLKTRIFEVAQARGLKIPDLAAAMGLHYTHIYRVRAGKRPIGRLFIEGARRAFPDLSLGDLFYIDGQDQPGAA